MMTAASVSANRRSSSSSASGAGSTSSTSLRDANGMCSAAAPAVSDETPGITRTGKRSANRAKIYMKEP